MKPYPSIPPVEKFMGMPTIAFYKYDGSNLRFEWSKNQGWYKYGTRTHLFDKNDAEFGKSITYFHDVLAAPLAHVIKDEKCTSAIVYCEWFGPNSFAGWHEATDEKKLVLFDVNIHKKGFVSPKTFVDTYSPIVPTAEVVYQGILDEEFFHSVRNQEHGEGVICKGGERHKLWMAKIKTLKYLERLKEKFGQNYNQYWE